MRGWASSKANVSPRKTVWHKSEAGGSQRLLLCWVDRCWVTHSWKFARSLKSVEFGFGDEKIKFGSFSFPVTFVLINLSDSDVYFESNKRCCLFFRVTTSLLRTNSRKLDNITQFPLVGCSEPENWVPQWSWGSTSLCFSAVFLQVSTQLQFLCKIHVKYECWPRLHTVYLIFIETRRHCYRAPVLSTNPYWKRSNNTIRFAPRCRDVCWCVLHGTRAFISLGFCSGICRRESVSIAHFPMSKYTRHRLGQDKKRWVSPLKMLSREQMISVKSIVDALHQRVQLSVNIPGNLH